MQSIIFASAQQLQTEKIELEILSKHDSCKAAKKFELGTVATGTTIGTANQTLHDGCFGDPAQDVGPGVWFSVEGTGQPLEATTCAGDPNTFEFKAEFDSMIMVHSGGSCENLECLIIGNDVRNCYSLSRVHWLSEIGKMYYVLVYGWDKSAGDFVLTIRTYNENCENAVGPLALGSITYGSPREATVDEIGPCGGADAVAFPGLWYKVQGTGGLLLVTTCTHLGSLNGDLDTDITLLSGSCGNLTCVDGNKDGTERCGEEAALAWQSTEGVEYYVLVHRAQPWTLFFHDFSLEFRETLNDACLFAIGLTVGSNVTGSTDGALPMPFIASVEACGEASEATSGLWYSVEPTDGTIKAEVCRSFDQVEDVFFQLTVLQGDCGNQTCVGGSNAVTVGEVDLDTRCTSVQWLSESSQHYFVFVHGHLLQTGIFHLEITSVSL